MPKKDSDKQSVNNMFDEWVKSSESLTSSMHELFEKIGNGFAPRPRDQALPVLW